MRDLCQLLFSFFKSLKFPEKIPKEWPPCPQWLFCQCTGSSSNEGGTVRYCLSLPFCIYGLIYLWSFVPLLFLILCSIFHILSRLICCCRKKKAWHTSCHAVMCLCEYGPQWYHSDIPWYIFKYHSNLLITTSTKDITRTFNGTTGE